MTQVESQGSALNGGSNLLFRKIVCFESCHFRSASYTSQTVFSLLFQDMNWGVKRNPADFVRKIKTSDYLISLLCHWSLVFRLQLGGRNSSEGACAQDTCERGKGILCAEEVEK